MSRCSDGLLKKRRILANRGEFGVFLGGGDPEPGQAGILFRRLGSLEPVFAVLRRI